MRLNKYVLTAVVMMFAVAFTGCKFTGTTENFKNNEYSAKTVTGSSSNGTAQVVSGNVTGVTSYIRFADEESEVEFTINSYGVLNYDSIDAAVSFYTLKDNSVDTEFYPVRDVVLPKTRKDISENITSTVGKKVTTTVTYVVDTSSVETEEIALFVDAAKLKERSGIYVLNGNRNEVSGEESDSYIDYIQILYKDDAITATDTLAYVTTEDLNPEINDLSSYLSTEWELDESSKPNGTLKLTFDVSSFAYTKNGVDIYPEDLASFLNKYFTVETRGLTEKKWKTETVSFAYSEADKNYVARISGFRMGIGYQVIANKGVSYAWTQFAECVGHPCMFGGYGKTKMKVSLTQDVYLYVIEEPSFIYNVPSSGSEIAFIPGNFSFSFEDNQKDVLEAEYLCKSSKTLSGSTVVSDVKIKVSIESSLYLAGIRFDKIDGFILVRLDDNDDYINTVPVTVAPYSSDVLGVYEVMITVKNKNLSIEKDKLELYVGAGTTILGNTAHPKQTAFGFYEINGISDLDSCVKIDLN